MKKITKRFTSILLVLLILAIATACTPPDNGSQNPPPPPSVSANEVINQSVAKLEDMMGIENSEAAPQLMAFVAPNYAVDYNNERLSVLRGSGIAVYFTQYLAKEDYGFSDGTVYKDTVTVENMTLNFYAKKAAVDGGVAVSLEMHQTVGEIESVSPIQIYFEYDYTAEQPSKTTIVSVTDNDAVYNIAIAQFDYTEEIAYSYNFQVSSADAAAVKTAFTNKDFDFEKFSACTASAYTFAKLYTKTGTIDSYAYMAGREDAIDATEDDVAALYNAIYGEVKDACVPVALLDAASATAKVYYQDMWTYGASRVSAIK